MSQLLYRNDGNVQIWLNVLKYVPINELFNIKNVNGILYYIIFKFYIPRTYLFITKIIPILNDIYNPNVLLKLRYNKYLNIYQTTYESTMFRIFENSDIYDMQVPFESINLNLNDLLIIKNYQEFNAPITFIITEINFKTYHIGFNIELFNDNGGIIGVLNNNKLTGLNENYKKILLIIYNKYAKNNLDDIFYKKDTRTEKIDVVNGNSNLL